MSDSVMSMAKEKIDALLGMSRYKQDIHMCPYFLDSLKEGIVITADAMGCQKDIAEKICKQEGDYLLSVKRNQGRLYRAIEEAFPVKRINDPSLESFVTEEKIMAVRKPDYI